MALCYSNIHAPSAKTFKYFDKISDSERLDLQNRLNDLAKGVSDRFPVLFSSEKQFNNAKEQIAKTCNKLLQSAEKNFDASKDLFTGKSLPGLVRQARRRDRSQNRSAVPRRNLARFGSSAKSGQIRSF